MVSLPSSSELLAPTKTICFAFRDLISSSLTLLLRTLRVLNMFGLKPRVRPCLPLKWSVYWLLPIILALLESKVLGHSVSKKISLPTLKRPSAKTLYQPICCLVFLLTMSPSKSKNFVLSLAGLCRWTRYHGALETSDSNGSSGLVPFPLFTVLIALPAITGYVLTLSRLLGSLLPPPLPGWI